MKRQLIIAAAMLALTACGTPNEIVPATITAESTDIQTEIQTQSETAFETESVAVTESSLQTAVSEARLRELMDRSIVCNLEIFCMSDLSTGDLAQDSYYYVTDERFPNFAALEDFVRSTFTSETAEMYLYNYPYEDISKYTDINGKLCLDINYSRPKGYFVDWSDYTISNISSDDGRCTFTVTAKITEPSDEPTAADYIVDGSAVLADGEWRLETMIQ